MLSDSEGIAKLARRDSSLAKKIVHWLDDYIGKLKKAVKDMESFSDAGRFLNVASDKMQDIRDRWYDALADATDNFNGRSGATTETADDIDVMDTVSESTEEVGETVAEVGETVDQTVDQTVDDDVSSVNDADMDALIDKVNYAEKYKGKLMKEFSPEEGEFAPDFTEYEEIDYDEDLRPVEKSESAKTEYAAATEEELFSFENEERKAAENKKASAENGEVRFSKRGVNKDGIEVYETSDEIKKLPYKKRMVAFKTIMEDQYRGRTAKFVRNGHAYYAFFDSEDVDKNIYGDKKSDPKGWKAKINVGADGNIFELVENALYDGSKAESGKKIASHRSVGYWDYFIKTVQIDNKVFDLVANVRKKSENSFVYSIQLKENKKAEASPPLGLLSKASNRVLNASNSKISQKAPVVNPSQANSSDNPSTDDDNRSSKRIDYGESDRAIIANALESVAETAEDKELLRRYKDKLSAMEQKAEELGEKKAQLHELMFTKGKRTDETKAKIDKLRADVAKLEKAVTAFDKRLLNMEGTGFLRDLVAAQRKQAAAKTAQKYREKISEGVEARGRKSGLERAEKLTKELITMLNRPTDKKHVPDELAVPLAKFLDSLEYAPTYNYRKDGVGFVQNLKCRNIVVKIIYL